jgi:hypothetical protein
MGSKRTIDVDVFHVRPAAGSARDESAESPQRRTCDFSGLFLPLKNRQILQ